MFHQQLDKVEIFNFIRNQCGRLGGCENYLKDRLRKRWARKVFRELRNNLDREQYIEDKSIIY